jgi:hypothetical protein
VREEIAQTKDHRFKLVGFGFIGMPSAYYLANAIDKLPDLEVLVLSFPLLICVIVLLYISESRTIMRCGTYIKDHIEPFIDGDSKRRIGWEHWLTEKGKQERRDADKHFTVSFYLLCGVYYGASGLLAVSTAKTTFGIVGLGVALGFYSAVGRHIAAFLVKHYKQITSTG